MRIQQLESRELIQLMMVPRMEGVFVLGSFEKRVTVYSQQVRAINLIHAMRETGELPEQAEVAIVGAGVAGLTAAAALLETAGSHVTILEREDRVLSLQRGCKHRWLHPHLYDWPEEGCFDPDANLPFLTWSADTATNVAGKIVDGWLVLKRKYDAQIREVFNVTKVTVTPSGEAGARVAWEDDTGPQVRQFRVVILAIGYGKEPHANYQSSYWAGDDIEHPDARRQRWLVSGCGDGGLTDVVRLLVHDSANVSKVAWLVGDATDHPDCQALLTAEQQRREKMHAAYSKIVDPVAERIQAALRKTDVTLNGLDAYPFGAHASILNRFLVSQLIHLKKLRYRAGASEIVSNSTPINVRFSDGVTEQFDRVLRRFGPKAAIETDFVDIWKAFGAQREGWKLWPSVLDRSRVPMWLDATARPIHPASSRASSTRGGNERFVHGPPPVDHANDEFITAAVDGVVHVPFDGKPLRIFLHIQALNNTRRNLVFRDHTYGLRLREAVEIAASDTLGPLTTRHAKSRLSVGFPDRPPIPAGGSYSWTLEFTTPGNLSADGQVISGPYKIIPQNDFLGVPVKLHTFWYDFLFHKPPEDRLAFAKEYKIIQANNRGLRPVIEQKRQITRCSFQQFQLGYDEDLNIHFTCLYRRAKYAHTLFRAIGVNV
jgi:hypothetical protein